MFLHIHQGGCLCLWYNVLCIYCLNIQVFVKVTSISTIYRAVWNDPRGLSDLPKWASLAHSVCIIVCMMFSLLSQLSSYTNIYINVVLRIVKVGRSSSFSSWNPLSSLLKTLEMTVDFRRNLPTLPHITIQKNSVFLPQAVSYIFPTRYLLTSWTFAFECLCIYENKCVYIFIVFPWRLSKTETPKPNSKYVYT